MQVQLIKRLTSRFRRCSSRLRFWLVEHLRENGWFLHFSKTGPPCAGRKDEEINLPGQVPHTPVLSPSFRVSYSVQLQPPRTRIFERTTGARRPGVIVDAGITSATRNQPGEGADRASSTE